MIQGATFVISIGGGPMTSPLMGQRLHDGGRGDRAAHWHASPELLAAYEAVREQLGSSLEDWGSVELFGSWLGGHGSCAELRVLGSALCAGLDAERRAVDSPIDVLRLAAPARRAYYLRGVVPWVVERLRSGTRTGSHPGDSAGKERMIWDSLRWAMRQHRDPMVREHAELESRPA